MVAASVALASLLRGEFDGACARICWRWALPGWSALTAGIILGSWWAYCELGWGGWWFWDPVENASLLPWLSATALLHSLSLTRQREIFRHWSLLLAIVTLMLSLLGTLIVRSGILVSVHAFALDNVRAVPLFSLFALISLASLALYGWRARDGGRWCVFGVIAGNVNPRYAVAVLRSATDRAGGNALSDDLRSAGLGTPLRWRAVF